MLCASIWSGRGAEESVRQRFKRTSEEETLRRPPSDYAPIVGGPDPHGRVERAGDDAFAVERDRVDLGRVTAKDVQALARVDVPQLRKKSVSQSVSVFFPPSLLKRSTWGGETNVPGKSYHNSR